MGHPSFTTTKATTLPFPRKVAILGSSGSIGRSAMEVVAASEGRLQVAMMSVHRRTDILVEQIQQMRLRQVADQLVIEEPARTSRKRKKHPEPTHRIVQALPECVIVTDEQADRTPLKNLPPEIEVRFGQDALCQYVRRPEVDVVLSGIVGSVGFESTWAALEAGKVVALANKESLVMGGPVIKRLAEKNGGEIIPVDSEHSAVFQCLRSRRLSEELSDQTALPHAPRPYHHDVSRVILTASGGPFRTLSLEELAHVTVADALAHPTWNMGKKITVDSATLMNKALEIIEARWLFDLPVEKLGAVLHPTSVVHSLVEFIDGSVIAQLSQPDMQLPIQLALCFPQRFESPARKIDWMQDVHLEFHPIDPERFPAIEIGLAAAQAGGTAGAVLNAANEVAVEAFLGGRLPFSAITTVCDSILNHHDFEEQPTLTRLLQLDRWARKETEQWISD